MGKLFYVILSSIVFFAVSCNTINTKFQEGIEFPKEVSSKSEIVVKADSLYLSFPIQMAVLDSMLIIFDAEPSNYFFHIYTISGKKLLSFGARGRGPGELIFPNKFVIDKENKIFVVSDIRKKVIMRYDIPALLRGDEKSFTSRNIVLDNNNLHIMPINFDKYVSINMSNNSRFRLYEGDKELYNYNVNPEFLSDSLTNVGFILGRGISNQVLKPDGTKFANGGEIGAALEVFSIKDNTIEEHNRNLIYRPIYTLKGGSPSQSLETRRGFSTMTATDDYIYTVLDHKKKSEERKFVKVISVFNWEAEPQFEIKTDYFIMSLCVGDNGEIYAACLDDDGNLSLVKFTIS